MVKLETLFIYDPKRACPLLRRHWLAAFATVFGAVLLTGCGPKSTSPQDTSTTQALVKNRISDIEREITAIKSSTAMSQNDKDREIAALQSEEAAMTQANPQAKGY